MAFAFRHQPLKALYLFGTIVYLLGSLPVWVVLAAIPYTRPRRTWSFNRTLIARIARVYCNLLWDTGILPPTPLSEYEPNAKTLGFVWVKATPELIVGEISELAEKNEVKAERTGGFWFGPRGPDGEVGQRASSDEKVVYHLHGGAHVMGTSRPGGDQKDNFAGCLQHLGPKVRVFGLEYRVSSAPPFTAANPFPASLIDAVAGYRYLVGDVGFEPRNIILSGDSAGGGIAINLARYIATANLSALPRPGGLILSSPTADWAQTHVGPESSMVRNSSTDVVHKILESGYTLRALVGRFPEEWGAKSAWISPGGLRAEWEPGMFAGFPRTAIVAGGAEYTLDAIHTFYKRLVKDNGKDHIMLIEPVDCTHDPLVLTLNEPERTEAFKQLAAWSKTL
ncbi:alpha/beta-hydrolase [Panus rudis PR-1116 ss-1]|nr:alpha/beta-hydrolase [Panus rudis PR-1116 ss-1]